MGAAWRVCPRYPARLNRSLRHRPLHPPPGAHSRCDGNFGRPLRGRAILGLGAGATGFAALGLSHADPATALCEAVELSRAALAGGSTHSLRGIHDPLRRRSATPNAARADPIYIAGRGEKVLRAAARVADAVLVATSWPALDSITRSKTIRAGAAERHPELPPLRLAAWAYLSLDDDAEAARDAVKPGVVMAVRTSLNVLMRAGVDVPGQLTTAIKSLPGGPSRGVGSQPTCTACL